MFGFVGIGQGGGNIANVAAEKGFHSIAINYSKKDLESLDQVKEKLKLVGSEGVGKRREDAISMMPNNIEMIQEVIERNFSTPSVEIIVVAFSTGGGTGSGISPLLIELLNNQMPDKVIVALPIIPDTSEGTISQFNCIKVSEELSSQDVAVFPIDNEKPLKELGKSNLYKTVNERVVDSFYKLDSYTNKHSFNGVLDKKDLLEIFKTPGVGLIAEQNIVKLSGDKETNITVDGITGKVHDSWTDSVFINPEKSQLNSVGIIFDGQEALMKSISQQKIFDYFDTDPIYVYEGNYHESKGDIITVLTGLDWYKTRLGEIEEILDNKKLSSGNGKKGYKSKLKFDLPGNKKEPEKLSTLDILNKYQR